MKDIFDYKNVKDILIGMSGKQLETLAEMLVEKHEETAHHITSMLDAYLQDKVKRVNGEWGPFPFD
ncbi:MAG: hypothetical protein CMO44_11390 [Verrucomicrobiales bacterium]|nr:hypothetical protein [Verrucomicrobiales bacterium]